MLGMKIALCHPKGRERELLMRELRMQGSEVSAADDGIALLELLSEDGYSVVIAKDGPHDDAPMPSALQVLAMARTAGIPTPFLLLDDSPDATAQRTLRLTPPALVFRSTSAVSELLAAVEHLTGTAQALEIDLEHERALDESGQLGRSQRQSNDLHHH
jgi:hypothetical protein